MHPRRPLSTRSLATMLLTLSPVAGITAQDSARAVLRGRVTPRAGTTWTDATVHLRWIGAPWRSEDGDERLTCKVDARGRFRAEVVPARRYAVWASTKTEAGVRITDVAKRVRAGEVVQLREQEAVVVKSIDVQGFEAWRGRKLRYMVELLGTSARETGTFAPDAHGRFLPPAMPPGRIYLQVCDAATGCDVVPQTRLPAASITLLKPLTVRYKVLDRDTKKPVRGARLVRLDKVDRRWREIGRANEKGICEVQDAGPRSWGHALFVHAEGYREFTSVRGATRAEDASIIRDIAVQLQPAKSIRGRLMLTEDVACVGTPLVSSAPGVFANGMVGGYARSYRTGVDGTFWVPRPAWKKDVASPWQVALFAALRPPELETLDRATRGTDPSGHGPLFPYVPFNYRVISTKPELRIEYPNACLSKWTRVDVSAIRADGSPSPFARIYLNVANAGLGSRAHIPQAPITDRRGRLSLMLPPGRWVIGVKGESETSITTMDLGVRDRPRRKALRCSLRPPRIASGVVCDADDKPVASAMVNWRVSDFVRDPSGERKIVASMARVVRTDTQGRFELRVPAVCGAISIGARRKGRRADRVEVAKGAEMPRELRLVLR